MTYERMSISQAIEAIQAEHNSSNYRLSKVLGITQIMIKRYLDGNVKSVNTKVAYRIYKTYGILVDSFNTVEELEACYEAL